MQINLGLDAAELEAATAEMAGRLADFTPYWEVVASPMIAGWFLRTWETEGAAIGSPWAPLTETTLELKGRRGRAGMGILRDSDRLMHSLTVRGDADQLRSVQPQSLFYGTAASSNGAPYPYYLQHGWTMHSIFGHEVEPRDVPARPFVPDALPDAWRYALTSTMQDYVRHGLS